MKRHIVEEGQSPLGIGYRLSSTDMPRNDEVDLGNYPSVVEMKEIQMMTNMDYHYRGYATE